MQIRNVRESDYDTIITVINEWWGGRHMADMLPRLFLKHFNGTSFIIEDSKIIVGFLIGFVSQTYLNQAYIHFIGIKPEYRRKDYGKRLYQEFFKIVKEKGCDTVYLVTSPINKNSIAFHTQIGFDVGEGNTIAEGVTVNTNYDGLGEDRVIFVKKI